MADVQKEHGYTPIANDIMMALSRVYIPNGPMRIILQVLRETWGYNCKWVQISHSKLGQRMDMQRQNVTREMDLLFSHNILRFQNDDERDDPIRIVTNDKRVKPIGFVKDFEKWEPFTRKIGICSDGKRRKKIGIRSDGKRNKIGICSDGKRGDEIGICSDGKVGIRSDADLENAPIILKERKTIPPPTVPPRGDVCKTPQTILSAVQFERFNRFWSVYPKKRSKGQAEKSWSKIKPSEQLTVDIVASVERAKTSRDWTKAGGQYIPYPATWLNAKGWEDEIDDSRNGGGNGQDPTTYAQHQDAERRRMARALLEDDDANYDWDDSQGADGAQHRLPLAEDVGGGDRGPGA